MTDDTIYLPSETDWERILVGHRITDVTHLSDDTATMTLDNGTRILVRGNEGCGGCSNGYYWVENIATVDNLIMAVRCDVEPHPENGMWDERYTYRVFVMTTNREIEALRVEGSDGNGYYGSGYYLTILED